ncbi:MAG: hypothetical protein AAFQ66_01235 [Pseudomonadota bacterium]
MAQKNELSALTVAVLLLALPTTVILIFFVFTNDATLRPLLPSSVTGGLDPTGRPPLRAYLTIPRNMVDLSRIETFADTVKASFRGKGLDVPVIVQRSSRASEATILFRVGRAEIGPFTARNVSGAVRAATEAYWMQPVRE